MKKWVKYTIWMLAGGICGSLMIGVSRSLIFNFGKMITVIGSRMRMEESVLSQVGPALGQLENASLVSPWFWVLLLGVCFGGLNAFLWRQCFLCRLSVCALCVVECVFLAVTALWFTVVNDIQLGIFLKSLLPLLSVLL